MPRWSLRPQCAGVDVNGPLGCISVCPRLRVGGARVVLMRQSEQAWPPGTVLWFPVLSLFESLNDTSPPAKGGRERAVVQCFGVEVSCS